MFFVLTLVLYLLGALTYTPFAKRIVFSVAPNLSRKEKRPTIILISAFWPLLATHLVLTKVWGR